MLQALPQRFIRREDGALTAFGLFLVIAMIIIGGLGIDVANAVMTRTHLQVAADSAAHAAIVAREHRTEDQAKAIAVNVAEASLPDFRYGDTILPSDIEFGTWDPLTGFTAVAGSDQAVRVSTQRLAARNNGMGTFFLRFVGLWTMDIRTSSVFETYYPTCLREGFVAEDRIDVQSGNHYTDGFCIHSNSHVELNNNNVLDAGVIVSMPNKADVVVPNSNNNTGLDRALRSGSYQPRIVQRIDDIIAGFDDPSSDYFRSDYLSNPIRTNVLAPNVTLEDANWETGEIHEFDCGTLVSLSNVTHTMGSNSNNGNGGGSSGGGSTGGGNNRVSIKGGSTLVGGVIYTDCELNIGQNATLEDVLIVSTNASVAAITGQANVTLGRDDGCAPGGGTQIITKGGVHFTSGLSAYGAQIVAEKIIDFEANANGVEGVSFISGTEIDSTSNMNMGFCNGAGLENRFEAEYFRLAN